MQQDDHRHHHQDGLQSDGNTLPPTPARSATSASTRSTTRGRMSAKRQNMMARRIEMRKRNEERERQHMEGEAHQQQPNAAAPITPRPHSNGRGRAAQQQNGDDMARNHSSEPQHYRHVTQPQMPHQPQPKTIPQTTQPRQRHHGQSILRNASDSTPINSANFPSRQHGSSHERQKHYAQGRLQPQLQPRPSMHDDMNNDHSHRQPRQHNFQDGHEQNYSQSLAQQQQQARPPMHGRHQHHLHSQSIPHNSQPRQKQQQQHNQYSTRQSTQQPPPIQPPPMTIPSPPMLQRKQQHSQIPVYGMGDDEGQGQTINQGVYNKSELEQSGIIRNHGSSHNAPQYTNRLKKISAHDSPSDEWFGLVNEQQPSHVQQQQPGTNRQASHNQVQQQAVRNQFDQPINRHQQNVHHQKPQHQPSQQPHRQHDSQRATNHDVGHPGALKNPSAEGDMRRNRSSQNMQEPQKPQQNQQFQNQNQPNWNDIDQKYHEDNRQLHYQRQLASRQQQMPQQPILLNDQQHPSSQSPNRPSHMSRVSPVEHLGNRTEQIQRKNNYKPTARTHNKTNPAVVSPNNNDQQPGNQHSFQHRNQPEKRQNYLHSHHHQQSNSQSNSYTVGGGEDSIKSVSNQARQFESSRVRRNSHLNTSGDSPNNVDEETVSVASLRKGWEGQPRSKSAPRSRHPPQASPTCTTGSHQRSDASPFGVWEERANRLARVRGREQRKEQKKNIEDRWRRNAAKSLEPERRGSGQRQQQGVDGYQSEGQARRDDHLYGSDRNRIPDGYQSEGPPQRRSRGRVVPGDYHDGYESEGLEEGQEIEYDDTLQNVDSGPITVEDARQRLWDGKERLRAVLPAEGSDEIIGDVRGRWPDEKLNGSPSTFSGSSGGLFKSKFVHAAALASRDRINHEQPQQHTQLQQDHQQRTIVEEEEEDHEQQEQKLNYEDRRNRWAQTQRANASVEEETQGWAQQRRCEDRQNPRRALQRQQQLLQPSPRWVNQHRPQQQQEFNSKKSHLQKAEVAASSHFTDSTAETTDVTTQGGSYGSTRLRKVSLSPPKRTGPHQPAAPSAMPPIAEQQALPPPTLQKTQPSSVTDLIAKINAVSRSNPEEALAAIDCILKREGGNGNGVCSAFVCGDHNRTGTPQDSFRGSAPPAPATIPPPLPLTKTNPKSLFSPSREATPPKKTVNQKANISSKNAPMPAGGRFGKDFFQETYEDVLRADSERVIRGSALEMERDENDDDDDMDDDSLLSTSDESTVSSMTNPTYQSLRSEQLRRRSPNTFTEMPKDIKRKDKKRSEQLPVPSRKSWNNPTDPSHLQTISPQQALPTKPQKSWATLHREYTQRKTPSPINNVEQGNAANARTPSNDIGVDEFEFNPDDIKFELKEDEPHRDKQPQTVSESGTNELATGFCGMNYRMAQSNSESKGGEEEYDHDAPPTPSTLTDSAWIPMPSKSNAFSGGRNNSNRWPFTANAPAKNKRLDMPNLVDKRSNNRAASSQQKRNYQPGIKSASNQRFNTTAQTIRNVNMPKRTQPNSNNMAKLRSMAKPSPPDVMKTVSDAFSDVDISLDEGRNKSEDHARRLIQQTRARPMMEEDGDADREQQASLQTISEAFSDVDVSFNERKTVNQRRKELEHLSNTWTNSKTQSQDIGSKSDIGGVSTSSPFVKSLAKAVKRKDAGGGGSTMHDESSAWTQPRVPAKAASRANEPQNSTTKGGTVASNKSKKRSEPTLRLKGNKSLAKKFASLVKAYDD